MRGMGAVNRWLDGLASWQFAVFCVSTSLAGYAALGTIIWLTARHPDLGLMAGYAAFSTILSTAVATWSRHRRQAGR
jgi:hypothetical protein